MKPGILTTEFWIVFAVTLAGLLPSSGLIPETHWGVKVCGLIVSMGTAMGYAAWRTSLKKPEAK